MKLLPAGLGAEPKKLAILGVLVVVLVGAYLMNRTPDSPGAAASSASSSSARTASRDSVQRTNLQVANRDATASIMPPQRTRRSADETIQDFKPSLKPPEGTDVSRIDPTLHLDVIAKLRGEGLEGGARSIFDFGAPPAPKTLPVVAPIKPTPVAPTPAPGPPPAPAAPPKPAIPPIPLKFYGYVDTTSSLRRAFFMQGDDIFVAGENDMVNNRYRIVRITANSAIVEDTTTKNQQTLPLVEELPG